jgi:hypothetical protein
MDENQWLGAPGDSIRSVLEAYVSALPQAEPAFSLLQFAPHEMNSMLRQHRNIIEITLGADGNDNPGIKVSRDKWSAHQLIFTVNSPEETHFFNLVKNEFPRIASIINNTEEARLADKYRRFGNKEIMDKVESRFGILLALPDDCKIASESSDFMWIKRERVKYKGNTGHEITQGFIVFRYPYRSETDLLPEAIMSRRDSLLKERIPGPESGTYMTTEYRYEPIHSVISKNNRYTVLSKGLWRVENYFMGGPFRCLTTLSSDNQYVISISGFVFAPQFNKREYARELEAVLSTVQFTD